MRLALAQYALTADVAANLAKVLVQLHRARDKGADLVLFPELCLSPFFPQYEAQDVARYRLSADSPEILAIRTACKELGLAAYPNVYLNESDRSFDATLAIDRSGSLTTTSKMVHIAQLPGFYEQDYYAPSDTGFVVHETEFGNVGVIVCFDRHFPESYRALVDRGAQLILIPTANVMSEPRDLFIAEIRASAYQNGVYIAMCNRVGDEGAVTFCGESLIVNPDGEIITIAGSDEELRVADLDLSLTERVRQVRPYLSLRRHDQY